MGLIDKSWADKIAGFKEPKNWDCKGKPIDCTPKQVEDLVKDTVGTDLTVEAATYVAIHVIDYASGSGNNLSNAWYLHHSKDSRWSFQKFTGQRIYGSPRVLFLFVHLNAKGVSATTVKTLKQDMQKELLGSSNSLCADDTDKHFHWLGNGAVINDYNNVRYESAVVKRTPANVANFLNILELLGFGAQAKGPSCQSISTEPVNVWGAGRIENIGLPSDITIAGYAVAAEQQLAREERSTAQLGAAGAFNDEPLYWWDASIGIPVHKLKDLRYSSSDNTVVAAEVDQQSVYAMFNLMLHPVDLSEPKDNVWPRLLFGFPLASSPWDKLFAGGAVGIPLKPLRNFQFFAGATFIRSKQPATLVEGSTADNAQLQNDLRITTTPKFTFGINVPVKSVFDQLRR